MQDIRSQITDVISKTIAGLNIPGDIPAILVEVPAEKIHGEFTCNVAMQLARALKKSPVVIAGDIVAGIESHLKTHALGGKIKKVEVKNPGCRAALKRNFSTVFFMAPTTTNARLKKNIAASTGFLYYVSLTGVTGVRTALSDSIATDVKRAKRLTNKPVCVGFGISTPDHVRSVGKVADGVIVGSAIVREIHNNAGKKDLVKNVSKYVAKLVRALKD